MKEFASCHMGSRGPLPYFKWTSVTGLDRNGTRDTTCRVLHDAGGQDVALVPKVAASFEKEGGFWKALRNSAHFFFWGGRLLKIVILQKERGLQFFGRI